MYATKVVIARTNAVSSWGLEMSFTGTVIPWFDDTLVATGVLSLSLSTDFEGVAGTFRGCAEGGDGMILYRRRTGFDQNGSGWRPSTSTCVPLLSRWDRPCPNIDTQNVPEFESSVRVSTTITVRAKSELARFWLVRYLFLYVEYARKSLAVL